MPPTRVTHASFAVAAAMPPPHVPPCQYLTSASFKKAFAAAVKVATACTDEESINLRMMELLDLLECYLRPGGELADAVSCLPALGVIMRSHPEAVEAQSSAMLIMVLMVGYRNALETIRCGVGICVTWRGLSTLALFMCVSVSVSVSVSMCVYVCVCVSSRNLELCWV